MNLLVLRWRGRRRKQLAEVKHELETTQLHLMEEETTRKIWEQDCKKAESQLAVATVALEKIKATEKDDWVATQIISSAALERIKW